MPPVYEFEFLVMKTVRHICFATALLHSAFSSCGQTYQWTTIAGLAGKPGFTDGTNGAARFGVPAALVVDSVGNLFVADAAYGIVRKLTPSGSNWVVTTIAGLANQYGSTDGVGDAARFSSIFGLAQDGSGSLYVADSASVGKPVNNLLRKITPTGNAWIVSTIAGAVGSTDSLDGTGSAARLDAPNAVAVDTSGNLFIVQDDNLVRKASPAGDNWMVTTIAGSRDMSGRVVFGYADGPGNTALFRGPKGVALDKRGNVYVTDASNRVIRKLTSTGAGWEVTTVAGLAGNPGHVDGTNSQARFVAPENIVFDQDDNAYITDNTTIRRMTQQGADWVVNTIGGLPGKTGSTDGTNSQALFSFPWGIGVDTAGNVYVGDSMNGGTIRRGVPVLPASSGVVLGISILPGKAVGLSWNAVPGQKFQVQDKRDVLQATWSNLGDPIVASGPVASLSDTPGQDTQKFYRVALLP